MPGNFSSSEAWDPFPRITWMGKLTIFHVASKSSFSVFWRRQWTKASEVVVLQPAAIATCCRDEGQWHSSSVMSLPSIHSKEVSYSMSNFQKLWKYTRQAVVGSGFHRILLLLLIWIMTRANYNLQVSIIWSLLNGNKHLKDESETMQSELRAWNPSSLASCTSLAITLQANHYISLP